MCGGRSRASQGALLFGLAVFVVAAEPASAWLTAGHRVATTVAVSRLPDEVPAFFREGTATISHVSVDPDFMRNRATPQLRARESPEHYLDLELVQGKRLPGDRWAFVALLASLGESPQNVGMVPYGVIEGMQRLTLAFAQHRRWPENEHVKAKALVYAGLMAHYAGDLSQPLHTTIHHDGRAEPDRSSPHSGIHRLVDGLLLSALPDPVGAADDLVPKRLEDPMAAVVRQLEESHRLVDRTYQLEPLFEDLAETGIADPEVLRFTHERFRAVVSFTADLFLSAWELSEEVELPEWLGADSPAPGPGAAADGGVNAGPGHWP